MTVELEHSFPTTADTGSTNLSRELSLKLNVVKRQDVLMIVLS